MDPQMVRAFAITPSNSVNFTQPCNKLYVGVAGDITLLMAEDTTAVLLKAVPVGFLNVYGSIKRVNSTGTTATDLVGFGVN